MFRSVADFLKTADPKPSKAELALIEACKWGHVHKVKDGTLPPDGTPDPDIIVRAGLLRLLSMGGTEKCGLHESGVWLEGAHVTETLDLRFARRRGQLVLLNCRIVAQPQLIDAHIDTLALSGSDLLDGLLAERTTVSGSVFLNDITAKGRVSLAGTEIGGQLVCERIDFQNARGYALNAQEMRLLGGFVFREVKGVSGQVDLTAAHVHDLVDDAASWAKCADLVLEGFTYDRLPDHNSPRSFKGRRDWLKTGSVFNGDFSPQPYTQLAKVFRTAGDLGEARKVLMERDRILAREVRLKDYLRPDEIYLFPLENPWADTKFVTRYFWDFAQRWLAGYGFAPIRALWAMAGLIVIAWALAAAVWNEGSFAPNSDVVLVSAGWQEVVAVDCFPKPAAPACDLNPAATWSNDPQKGMDWDSFNAFGYAADLVIPILDLGQTDAWAPSKDRGDWGFHLWWGRWLLAALGWIVTALGAAAVTGIMQRNSPD